RSQTGGRAVAPAFPPHDGGAGRGAAENLPRTPRLRRTELSGSGDEPGPGGEGSLRTQQNGPRRAVGEPQAGQGVLAAAPNDVLRIASAAARRSRLGLGSALVSGGLCQARGGQD